MRHAQAAQRGGHFPLIDEMRAVAALTVLVGHIDMLGAPTDPFRYQTMLERRLLIPDGVGVPLFFVLSGFLLFGQFARAAHRDESLSARRFWRNRALRILPGYWAALLVLGIYPGLDQLNAKVLPFNILLLHAWIPGYTKSGIGPSWTLCAEVAFYALLPLIAAGIWKVARHRASSPERTLRIQLMTAGALWAGSLLLALVLTSPERHIRKLAFLGDALPGVFHWFALGMALASLYAYRQAAGKIAVRDTTARWWLTAAGLHVVGAVLLTAGSGVERVVSRGWQGVIAFCVMAPLAQVRAQPSRAERAAARFPQLAWLGLVSYGIYIWQVPIMEKLAAVILSGRRDFGSEAAFAVACVAVVIAVAALSYYIVERPALRLKDRTSLRRRPIVRLDDPTVALAEEHAAP